MLLQTGVFYETKSLTQAFCHSNPIPIHIKRTASLNEYTS